MITGIVSRAAIALLALAPHIAAQALRSAGPSPGADVLAHRSVTAVRIEGQLPTIDGRLDDAVWQTAPIATDFVQSRPTPGAVAVQRTEARLAYDEDALYVAVRMFDPHPEQIVAPFPRRDFETTSDWVFVEIDSRHDRRSAFSFGVNPRGVQVDGTWANDVIYDAAWNGVWQSAARIDSLGWTVEYRIPFSQLALPRGHDAGEMVFGLNVYRYEAHVGEVSNWSPRLPTINGVVSHFNDIRGIALDHRPAELEVTPYVGARAAHAPPRTGDAANAALPRGSSVVAGADARLALPGGFSLAATVHPDFSQVEADPSEVNLTSFETFFAEQRPFFVEGADAFTFNEGNGIGMPLTAGADALASESPFYSRRIGRAPHDDVIPSDARVLEMPAYTNILGAAKLVGRSTDGWAAGLLAAQTATERASIDLPDAGRRDMVVEPSAQYVVGRVTRESSGGGSAAGAMITAVHRSDAEPDSSMLPANAVFAGLDGRHRFGNDEYEASAFAAASLVNGGTSAMREVELAPAHYLQRPDAAHLRDFTTDSARTSLSGTSAQARVAKLGGGHWRWSAIGQSISPAFEVNDVGFQRNSDWLIALGTLHYVQYHPGRLFRTWTVGVDQIGAGWSYGGERRAAVATVSATGELLGEWGGTITAGRELASLSTEALRGGPALLTPARTTWSASAHSDTRKPSQVALMANGFVNAGGNGHGTTVGADIDTRLTDRLRIALAPSVSRSNEALQYVQHLDTAGASSGYIVGRLVQTTASLTARMDLALSPQITLQLYAQPLIGSASYSDFGEVVVPRAADVRDRVHPVGDRSIVSDPSFGTREVLANAVFRWEYRPGSTLFVVFTQQRDAQLDDPSWRFGSAARELWRVPASNVLMVKWSYWWTP